MKRNHNGFFSYCRLLCLHKPHHIHFARITHGSLISLNALNWPRNVWPAGNTYNNNKWIFAIASTFPWSKRIRNIHHESAPFPSQLIVTFQWMCKHFQFRLIGIMFPPKIASRRCFRRNYVWAVVVITTWHMPRNTWIGAIVYHNLYSTRSRLIHRQPCYIATCTDCHQPISPTEIKCC